jgi:hypothetical protein
MGIEEQKGYKWYRGGGRGAYNLGTQECNIVSVNSSLVAIDFRCSWLVGSAATGAPATPLPVAEVRPPQLNPDYLILGGFVSRALRGLYVLPCWGAGKDHTLRVGKRCGLGGHGRCPLFCVPFLNLQNA